MRLTPLEWGLRAPHHPAARGELLGATARGKIEANRRKTKPTLNTKLRILPVSERPPANERQTSSRIGYDNVGAPVIDDCPLAPPAPAGTGCCSLHFDLNATNPLCYDVEPRADDSHNKPHHGIKNRHPYRHRNTDT